MFESGYYPAGAEFDPRAPYNEVEKESEEVTDVSVEYTTTCAENEILWTVHNLEETLQKKDNVCTIKVTDYDYDEGELTIDVDAEVFVVATAYGNYINNRNPEPTEEDIKVALDEQWKDILNIEGFEVERI